MILSHFINPRFRFVNNVVLFIKADDANGVWVNAGKCVCKADELSVFILI